MVESIIIDKKYTDAFFEKKNGYFFDESYYDYIINNEIDCYFEDRGEIKILFKLRKNVIPKKMHKTIRGIFEKHAKTRNNQRAMAAGGEVIKKNNVKKSDTSVRSNIVGYYDRPRMIDKKFFNTNIVCRRTSFTKNNEESWKKSLGFFKIISDYYKKLAPEHYKIQKKIIKNSPYKIGNTPFTTSTINYNWRTACHKDKGDYSDGLGNLVVLGENFKGSYIGFPQFKVAVNVEPGDIIIMNVHEWHCNTELYLFDKTSVRLSFVCYLRENMTLCDKKTTVKGEEMYYKGK